MKRALVASLGALIVAGCATEPMPVASERLRGAVEARPELRLAVPAERPAGYQLLSGPSWVGQEGVGITSKLMFRPPEGAGERAVVAICVRPPEATACWEERRQPFRSEQMGGATVELAMYGPEGAAVPPAWEDVGLTFDWSSVEWLAER